MIAMKLTLNLQYHSLHRENQLEVYAENRCCVREIIIIFNSSRKEDCYVLLVRRCDKSLCEVTSLLVKAVGQYVSFRLPTHSRDAHRKFYS